MRYFTYEEDVLKEIINSCTYKELIKFAKYINDVAPGNINIVWSISLK